MWTLKLLWHCNNQSIMATCPESMAKPLSALIVFGLVVRNTVSLQCYFCKSDYNSHLEDEEETVKDIPLCGREPYEGYEEHVVDCSIYYDNAAMTHPTFREALSSTTHRGEGEGGNSNDTQKTKAAEETRSRENNASTKMRSILQQNIYPYNLTNKPWGSQMINKRASPYYCLTVHTFNATFPSRVCGLRYFLDCAMLIELTSEPLQPSSFIKDCYECRTNFCNEANTFSPLAIFVTYSSVIHCIVLLISQPP